MYPKVSSDFTTTLVSFIKKIVVDVVKTVPLSFVNFASY